MEHRDHVALIKAGVEGLSASNTWADLGAGAGAFTLALADCLGGNGTIYAVDQDRRVLDEQARLMRSRFPAINAHYLTANFTRRLDLPPLDGVVMANSLHFERQKEVVLQLVRSYLKPGGRLILVEYNVDQGNAWVPYPLSYGTWEKLARQQGFVNTKLVGKRTSRFLDEMYAAVSYWQPLHAPSPS
ncbi:MAG: class I SAM-dependent methyltransferase [Anaerolineae bacterium]